MTPTQTRSELHSFADDLPEAPAVHPPVVKAEIGGTEVVDRLATEWRKLCDEGPNDHPFQRPEWIRAFARAFSPGRTLVVVTARKNDQLTAVLPLVKESGSYWGLPVTKLRGAANWHTCRFDLVRAKGIEGDKAVMAMWGFLRELPEWNVLELPDVPQGASLERFVSLAQEDGFRIGRWASILSPFLPIPGGAAGSEDWSLRAVSHNFRHDLRRFKRKLSTSEGELDLERAQSADAATLHRFYDLESSGWKGRERTAITCDPLTRQFYDEIAEQAQRYGYLSLYFLKSERRIIAGHFGLTYKGRYFMPKVAYDENYKQYSPGQLLVSAIVRDCQEHGICEVDFLGPNQSWKMRWTERVRPHAYLYIFNRDFYSKALHEAKCVVAPALKNFWNGIAKKCAGRIA